MVCLTLSYPCCNALVYRFERQNAGIGCAVRDHEVRCCCVHVHVLVAATTSALTRSCVQVNADSEDGPIRRLLESHRDLITVPFTATDDGRKARPRSSASGKRSQSHASSMPYLATAPMHPCCHGHCSHFGLLLARQAQGQGSLYPEWSWSERDIATQTKRARCGTRAHCGVLVGLFPSVVTLRGLACSVVRPRR